MGEFLLIILVPLAIIGGLIYLTQAPSATGVSSSSSRRGKKKVRITFLHCWLFHDYPLMPFRTCPTQDGTLLLTQAMHPFVERLPVAHYRDLLEAKGIHPTIDPKHMHGQTDWTLAITWGAILYTSHQLDLTHDQARYWLLCHFYAVITKQHLVPVVIEEEPEEEIVEEISAPPLAVLAPVRQEEPLDTTYDTVFSGQKTEHFSFPLDVLEEEEEPDLPPIIVADQTLTELLSSQDKKRFMTLIRTKLTKIYQFFLEEGKITQQPLLNRKIINGPEWRFLLNGEKGILWELGIVQSNDLGETVIGKNIDAAFSLVEQWSEEQEWGNGKHEQRP